jgi:hypothetical protein
MKKLLLSGGILMLSFLSFNGKTQTTQANTLLAEMTFKQEVHDYGDIKQGANGDCEFTFTNTGSAPLIISNARGSCQCTVPEWPKTPVQPGQSATIKVHYNTNRSGPINKTVTIEANVEGGSKVLRIKGNVLAAETAGVPVNNPAGPRND